MPPEQIDLKQLTETELKALCFDLVCTIEETREKLNVVRNELQLRLPQQQSQQS